MKKAGLLLILVFLLAINSVFGEDTIVSGFGTLDELCTDEISCIGECGDGYSCSEDRRVCECISDCPDLPYEKECAVGYYCNPSENACVFQLDFGEYCNEDYECPSGICNSLISVPRYRITSFAVSQPIFEETQTYFNTGKICVEENRWIGACGLSCSEDGTGCLEGSIGSQQQLHICESNYYCNPSENACIQKNINGESCNRDVECRSNNCHDTADICIGINNWIGECPSELSCSEDRIMCGFAGNDGSGLKKLNYKCANGFYCNENSCVESKEDGESCTLNNECQSNRCVGNVCSGCTLDNECEEEFTCSENRCTAIPCSGVVCSEGQICNQLTNACEEFTCVSDSECGIGYSCEEGSCILEEEIVPIQRCTTTSECEENLICTLSPGSGGVCSECTTEDIDSDGILDCSGEDPCVGSAANECLSDDLGLSCASIGGITCNGVCGEGSYWSTVSTELNCCYSETGTATCESNPIYISESGLSAVLRKSCTADGRSEVEVVDSGGNRISNRDTLLLIGFDPSRGNPYIDSTDYSCSNINLGTSTTGADIPAYGLAGFLLTISLLAVFYWRRKH